MPIGDPAPSFVEPVLGVVFDLDGTLVLSGHDYPRMRRTVIEIAERYGVPRGCLSADDPIFRSVERAREELRDVGAGDAAIFRFEAEYPRAIDAIEMEALPRTRPRPGAAPLLAGLSDRGFRLGILTRSSEHFARAALERTGLAPYFPYLRSRSAPGPAKPSPEALLLLLREMGIPVDRALYVGDHLLDAECARGARVRFMGVLPDAAEASGGAETAERFRSAGASAVAADLPDLARRLVPEPSPAAPNPP